MSVLWPRLTPYIAESRYEAILGGAPLPTPAIADADALFAPIGGRTATPSEVNQLSDAVRSVATDFGFPDGATTPTLVAFDRAAAPIVRRHMDLSWAEAGSGDVWSFLALVVLPDVTAWRFKISNAERWLAGVQGRSDLTRHTWARLWWHAVVFDGEPGLLNQLTESDLNQILERRTIGGSPRLACAIASAVVDLAENLPRRILIRDVSIRLRRRLAYTDVQALSDQQIKILCQQLMLETIANYDPQLHRPKPARKHAADND